MPVRFFGGMMANFMEFWYYCMHVEMCFICVKSAGHRTVSGWFFTTPPWHRTVPGWASADDIIYRRRPPAVRYVTTQEKFLKNRPMPGRLSNSPVMCKSLKSYVVSLICDHNISCVPIFTMQTSVVVAQWLESVRPVCLLFMIVLLHWFLFNISLLYTQLFLRFLIWKVVSLCTTMMNTGRWLCYMHVIAII